MPENDINDKSKRMTCVLVDDEDYGVGLKGIPYETHIQAIKSAKLTEDNLKELEEIKANIPSLVNGPLIKRLNG